MKKSPAKIRQRSSDYACQFMTHSSLLHRIGPGWKMGFGTLLSILAVGIRTPTEIFLLVLVTLGYYGLARLTPYDLWRDIRLLAWQGTLIIGAYCLVHGVTSGFWPGVRTCLQIMIFYLPGAVFLRTTSTGEVMAGLRRFVPYRLSFLVTVSIRFVPFFLREMEEIAVAQRLRGARLLPRQQLDPRNWGDLFHCLLLPLMVRALKTADDVSRSAEARGFGLLKERTYYDLAAGVSCSAPAGEASAILVETIRSSSSVNVGGSASSPERGIDTNLSEHALWERHSCRDWRQDRGNAAPTESVETNDALI